MQTGEVVNMPPPPNSPSAQAPTTPIAATATPSTTQTQTFFDWHPTRGSQAVELTAFNGFGLGYLHWYSDSHSEEDILSCGTSLLNLDQGASQSSGYLPINQSYSWNATFNVLERWQIFPLGHIGSLNLVAGPYVSYAYSYLSQTFNNQPFGFVNTNETYTLGIKAGADVEFYLLKDLSIQLGYLVSASWQKTNLTSYYNAGDESTFYGEQWTVGSGTDYAGLNYYFR